MPRPVWWTLLHTHILGKRSRASAEKYEKIWTEEGSPLIAITTSLERGLNEYYADRGLPVMVRAGMSYGKPQIKRVVKELRRPAARSWWCCPCTRSRPSPLPAR